MQASSRVLWRFSSALRAVGGHVRLQSTVASAHFTLPDDVYQLHRLDTPPSREVVVTRDEMLHYLKEMYTIREMENEARALYQQKKIRGFLHLYIGQEACAVGMESVLTRDDPVITAYRCHGWTYTRGIPVKKILAELAGRSTGVQKGKGGSMHMYAPNYYGGNGIVGAQVPLGAGIGFALKYEGSDRICVTLYGDGAANQGQVFEAFNMAALWKLPCLFVCENNRYGMGTTAARSSASTEYYSRGDYIPGIKVDGMNLFAVREATKLCTEYIRSGKGPLVMELDTYRYHGHSMSDPGKSYRKTEEVKAVRQERDPIKQVEEYGIEGDLVTAEEIKEMNKKIKAETKEAVTFALDSPEPLLPALYENIHSGEPVGYVQGCDPFTSSQTVSAV